VITLAGNRHAGRVGNSILNQTGLGNLVAASREHYVALAGKLAENVDQLRTLRQTLRTRVAASPLGDGARLARSMEKTFSGMCGAADPASSDN